MDTKITLSAMSFYAHHGCYETEQKVGTRFRVDLSVSYNAQQAATSDNIDHSVNYLSLYESVREQMSTPSHLLENVAQRILAAIADQFKNVNKAEVAVTKIAPPLGGDIQEVTVTMERIY